MIAIVGAAAVSAYGLSWRGLGRAIERGTIAPAPSIQLAASHGEVLASEVPPIEPADDAGDARQRKLMTRAARLAAIAARRALAEVGWTDRREEIGFFLGVGASGVALPEMPPMLQRSIDEGRFSLPRFGREGLAACNPLFAFQTMNNFTLCHGAILEGTGGPNAAYYSRGGGTVLALEEALWAIAEGTCDCALAGGADSALHPVTYAELQREGWTAGGLVPGEGAALLTIAAEAETRGSIACVLGCLRASARRGSLLPVTGALADRVLDGMPVPDLVVIAPWGSPARAALLDVAEERAPQTRLLDLSLGLGDALAATPALAWVVALDQIASGDARTALVLSAGIDGEVGAVLLG